MVKKDFIEQLDVLAEKHLPEAFLDYDILQYAKNKLSERENIGRLEILLIAYLVGANSKESDDLLRASGHPTLYVKRREDAIWRFVLNHRPDCTSIFNEIFPQNEDQT